MEQEADRPADLVQMSTVFQGILVGRLDGRSYLLKPLSERRMLFLQSLGLDERVFTDRVVPSLTSRRGVPDD